MYASTINRRGTVNNITWNHQVKKMLVYEHEIKKEGNIS